MVYSASKNSKWNLQQSAMNHPKLGLCRLESKTPKWNCAPAPPISLKQSTQCYSIHLRLYGEFQRAPKFGLEGTEIGKINDPLLLPWLEFKNAKWYCAPELSNLGKQITQSYRELFKLSIAFQTAPKFALEGIVMC